MYESKYSKVLTVVLVIIIIAIVVLLALLGYDWYQKYFTEQEALAFAENYKQDDTQSGESDNTNTNTEPEADASDPLSEIEKTGSANSNTSQTNAKPTFKGFGVEGYMSIPSIKFEYPILEKVSKKSIETAVAFLYGAGVNKVGNTVIIGHNYRNGLFFSNNKKLKEGDKIYITDNAKNRITYTIYNKFETSPEDISFYQRDTNGRPEITLSTCTDDSKARLIIFAKAD